MDYNQFVLDEFERLKDAPISDQYGGRGGELYEILLKLYVIHI